MIRAVITLLVLGFGPVTHAAERIDVAALDRALTDASTKAFETQLRTPLRPAALKALLRARYTSAADRAYIDGLKLDQASPVKIREFTKTGEVYSIVMPNGRAFTLTSTDGGRTVRVNGVMLAWSELPLEKYAQELEAALHRTFVVRHFPLVPLFSARPAEALFGIPMLATALGITAYFGIKHALGPSPAERVEARYRNFKATCDAERADTSKTYPDSTTMKTVGELQSKQAALVAYGKKPGRCEIDVERDLVPVTEISPRFSAKDMKKACQAALDFMECAEGFRNDPVDPAATVNFSPKGPVGTGR